jgi:hypothetical protein
VIEAVVAVVLALTICYSAGAYRFDFPAPFPTRHELALRHIAELELALGMREETQPPPPSRDYQMVTIEGNPYVLPRSTTRLPAPGSRPFGGPPVNGRGAEQHAPRTDTKGTA